MSWKDLVGQEVVLFNKRDNQYTKARIERAKLWAKTLWLFAQPQADLPMLAFGFARAELGLSVLMWSEPYAFSSVDVNKVEKAWYPEDEEGEWSFTNLPPSEQPKEPDLPESLPRNSVSGDVAPLEPEACCMPNCYQNAHIPFKACSAHLLSVFPDGCKTFTG